MLIFFCLLLADGFGSISTKLANHQNSTKFQAPVNQPSKPNHQLCPLDSGKSVKSTWGWLCSLSLVEQAPLYNLRGRALSAQPRPVASARKWEGLPSPKWPVEKSRHKQPISTGAIKKKISPRPLWKSSFEGRRESKFSEICLLHFQEQLPTFASILRFQLLHHVLTLSERW